MLGCLGMFGCLGMLRCMVNVRGMMDKIIQVSGFGVANTSTTQCNYLLVGLTESGKVVLSTGDGHWADVSPKETT